MSSNEKKYIKEDILKKFDEFIQESLNKYFYVDAWNKLYSITGKDSYDIISNKSTIPDLVIYNKPFNKNDCFFNSNKKSKHKKFPRVQFILRPREIEFYNPSNTYAFKNEEEEETNSKILEPFEFRSIPKEIEDKYNKNINAGKENNNSLLDEMKAFMKDDKNDESKVKLIKVVEKNGNKEKVEADNHNKDNNENKVKKRKDSNINNNRINTKNKFESPMNMNIMNNINYNSNMYNTVYNNYLIYQRTYYQKMNSLNNINKIDICNISNSNNNHINPIQKEKENKENINNDINKNINNNVNNVINDNNNKNNTNSITSYYNNNEIKDVDIEKIINNIDELINKNERNRNWKVIDLRNNITMYKFNSEELFLFLKTVINSKEDKNYSISDIDCDILFNPIKIYEDLKNKYQKNN